jgi:hypothetical protein
LLIEALHAIKASGASAAVFYIDQGNAPCLAMLDTLPVTVNRKVDDEDTRFWMCVVATADLPPR